MVALSNPERTTVMGDEIPTKAETLQLAMLMMIASHLEQLLHAETVSTANTKLRDYYLKTDEMYSQVKDRVTEYIQQYSPNTHPKN
jgi:hypothetical protein